MRNKDGARTALRRKALDRSLSATRRFSGTLDAQLNLHDGLGFFNGQHSSVVILSLTDRVSLTAKMLLKVLVVLPEARFPHGTARRWCPCKEFELSASLLKEDLNWVYHDPSPTLGLADLM